MSDTLNVLTPEERTQSQPVALLRLILAELRLIRQYQQLALEEAKRTASATMSMERESHRGRQY